MAFVEMDFASGGSGEVVKKYLVTKTTNQYGYVPITETDTEGHSLAQIYIRSADSDRYCNLRSDTSGNIGAVCYYYDGTTLANTSVTLRLVCFND